MNFEKSSRLVFVGDSITDCSRDFNAQLGVPNSLGDGFVSLINGFTTGLYPEKEFMVINKGIGGNTILDLKKRWQVDVLDIAPDVVTIMIGINDVWRHFDGVFSQSPLVSEEVFKQTYQELIDQTLAVTGQIIVMSPFMFDTNMTDPMRQQLSKYQAIATEMAATNNLPYVDVQAAVDRYLAVQHSYALSGDRIHPSALPGHMLIAKEWLDAVGFEWQRA